MSSQAARFSATEPPEFGLVGIAKSADARAARNEGELFVAAVVTARNSGCAQFFATAKSADAPSESFEIAK